MGASERLAVPPDLPFGEMRFSIRSNPKTFSILDKKDQINLIREIAEEQSISLKDHTAKKLLEATMKEKAKGDYVSLIIGTDKTPLASLIASTQKDEEKVFYHYLKKTVGQLCFGF